MSPRISAISGWGWVFLTVRGGIDPGYHPDLLELHIYGRINDPGMEHYRPQMRRDLDVATLAARWLNEPQPINNQ